jgi:hypothetical protein
MSIGYSTEVILARINPESEDIGIHREVMGQNRWYFDCESCNIGSRGYPLLSALLRAINAHKLDRHNGYWLDLTPDLRNNYNHEQGDSPLSSNQKGA